MTANQSIVLITGANGGIGFELAAQLLTNASRHVLLGSRSTEKGEAAVKDLKSRNLPGTVELVVVDVTSEDSVALAAKSVTEKHGRLDALVNNAGVAQPSGSLAQSMEQCYRTNAIGPQLMLDAFGPLLKKSAGTPRIVNVSSIVGSITDRMDPSSGSYHLQSVQYRASKAGLNMVHACMVYEYGQQGFKVFAYCPGFSQSNLSSGNIAENGAKPVAEAAAPIVSLLNGERDAEHGTFVHENGQYPW